MNYRNLLLIYTGVLAVIILVKFILWINPDYPIGRLSILHLLSLIAILNFRNRFTYVIFWLLSILPFAWRIIEHRVSGTTPLEYTFGFYAYFNTTYPNIASFFINFPYYFAILMCLTILLRGVRILYGVSKNGYS